MIKISNPDAVARAIDYAPGLVTRNGVLVHWPNGLEYPTQEDIDRYESEYSSAPVKAVDRWDALEVLRTRNDIFGSQGITVSDIESEILSIPNPLIRDVAMIDFTRPRWYRNHSLISIIATSFNLSESQIDSLFAAASELERNI